MAKDVFLFTGCSHVSSTSTAGGGWVAVCDRLIAYGNGIFEDRARVAAASASAGLAGVRFALDAFPDAKRVLLSTDGGELQFVPCGALAGGIDPTLDPTGIVSECRGRGVEFFVRWWPGHNPGTRAADIMLLASRVLAVRARRGDARREDISLAPGWRSRLALSVGRSSFDRGIKESGLTWRQASELTGLHKDLLSAHVDRGALKVANPGGVTLSSALELRDVLEADGTVTWPEEDFGQGHLDECRREPAGRLYVACHAHGNAHGVAISRRWTGNAEVRAQRVKFSATVNRHRAGVAATLMAVAHRLGDFACGGVVEVVTADPWLAMLLDSRRVQDVGLTSALDVLSRRSVEHGISLRPRLVREEVVRASAASEPMAFMQVALAAAKVASASEASVRRSPNLMDGEDSLLRRVLTDAANLGDVLTRTAQAKVTEELFDLAPAEVDSRARFEALASATHAACGGRQFARRPILPGAFRDGIALVGDAVHASTTPLPMDEALKAEWAAWWSDHAAILVDHPAMALREAILRIDAEADLTRWSKARHLAVADWIGGIDETCPFKMPLELQERARVEMRPLLDACGGWPFKWFRTPTAKAA